MHFAYELLKRFVKTFNFTCLQVAGSEADTLQKVDVPVVNIDKCKRALNTTYRPEDVSTENNLCAGGLKGYQYDLNIHNCNDLVIILNGILFDPGT